MSSEAPPRTTTDPSGSELLMRAVRAVVDGRDLARRVVTEPTTAQWLSAPPDLPAVTGDIELWTRVFADDVPSDEVPRCFEERAAAHARRGTPPGDAVLVQHGCVNVLVGAVISWLEAGRPHPRAAEARQTAGAVALRTLQTATAAIARSYRLAAAARVPRTRDPLPESRRWCLAVAVREGETHRLLERFRAANPQASADTDGTTLTCFTSQWPTVPEGFGPYGVAPVEGCDTDRAAGRAGLAAAAARRYRLDHVDARQLLPLLAASDLDPDECDAFLTACLGPLHTADGNEHLMETLRAYLSHNLCTTAAARSLYVHRHTFAYRMRCIRSLTGLDPDRPFHRLRAELALLLREASRPGGRPRPRLA
ncbi:PucR family transcriptional regulator [Streptomyces lycii]|uniref:PucR family transcriptional regulator n=1 Tax=Streptomyces lycii TaxID=2654337 RepID=A0ABQ7FRP4_9ACTN|nr:helix-turn-helix domain-containing protein [Streptomyces lycii]KAF4410938.1 PucR family transcriptional regulator [Streptomyces lycii]